MYYKLFIALIFMLLNGAVANACSLGEQSSFDKFAWNDTIVIGHWEMDGDKAMFHVKQTWLGEDVPAQPYAVYYISGVGSACEMTTGRYAPRDIKTLPMALAVELSEEGLHFGYFTNAAQVTVKKGKYINVEGYGERVDDDEGYFTFRLYKRDFTRARELTRNGRKRYFDMLRNARTQTTHSDR